MHCHSVGFDMGKRMPESEIKPREIGNELRALTPDMTLRSRNSSLLGSHPHLFSRVRARVWLMCVLTLLIFTLSCQRHSAGKRVEVDKTNQVLRAYAGDKLVLESPVSTGKEGHSTPNGTFAAGEKSRMHHSGLYENAPMPYSVDLGGGYFIHGFNSVPAHPASHGCIRLP